MGNLATNKPDKEIRKLPSILMVGAVLNSLLIITSLLTALLVLADPMIKTKGGAVLGLGESFSYPPALLLLIPSLITANLGIKAGQEYIESSAKDSGYAKHLITICRTGQVLGIIALALIAFGIFFLFMFLISW